MLEQIKDLDPDLECKYPVTEENKIHGVAFVFNLETVDNLSADVLNEFRKLQALVGQKYLYRIVIGTHFDQIGIPKSHEAYIYQYKRLQEKFSQLSEDIKMDKRVMFAISNDLKGGHIEITKAVLALYALENMVRNLDLFFRVTHQ
ncbi:hypothetical protein chiPu_0020355 [Chiloscyllium punctatum]|uniref:Uncharacterized protein n=1 Tax=Chiloscyllium punctatum TaxID=137246 RepID=A0A401RER3_CHIPU|nr:hypothetical protein [Chiloscyllium punctatum]